MKKKKIELLSLTEINGEIIPYPDITNWATYSNKKLRDFTYDDFASLVIDSCDADGNMVYGQRESPLFDKYDIPYLRAISKDYPRVYLYGVWFVVHEHIMSNMFRI